MKYREEQWGLCLQAAHVEWQTNSDTVFLSIYNWKRHECYDAGKSEMRWTPSPKLGRQRDSLPWFPSAIVVAVTWAFDSLPGSMISYVHDYCSCFLGCLSSPRASLRAGTSVPSDLGSNALMHMFEFDSYSCEVHRSSFHFDFWRLTGNTVMMHTQSKKVTLTLLCRHLRDINVTLK